MIESTRSQLVKERIDKCACTSRSCARFLRALCMRALPGDDASPGTPTVFTLASNFVPFPSPSFSVVLFPLHFFLSLSLASRLELDLYFTRLGRCFIMGLYTCARVSLCFLELKRRVYYS